MRRLHTLPPLGKLLTSGSRPRLPIRITLFTDPAIALSYEFRASLALKHIFNMNKILMDGMEQAIFCRVAFIDLGGASIRCKDK